jgi:alpha-amylase
MPNICLYFQLHQPYRLDDFNVFDISHHKQYFSTDKNDYSGNQQIFKKVAAKSYLPMLRMLRDIAITEPRFKLSLSCSGIFLEQAEQWEPEIIRLIKEISQNTILDLLSETYYHSLSFLYSKDEFIYQIIKHRNKIEQIFEVKPQVFRNTELIYSNEIAQILADGPFKFKGILTEAVEPFLGGRDLTQVFRSYSEPAFPLLLKHAQFSDDIAFRFSNPDWEWYPLYADRYLDWIQTYPDRALINLFMDFETFGEHQWADTGIFEFFKSFIHEFLQSPDNQCVTPTEIFSQLKEEKIQQLPVYDVPRYISWADIDRDLTAWLGNPMQVDALRALYALEKPVLNSDNQALIDDWRKLQTSDHFYYMCTKWSADGDVHAYFSPYDSPLEAYRRYSVVLADLEERLL